MSFDAKTIYELLPAVYRIRDDEQGKPLEAFINIVAEQALIVEKNIDELYNNWFIETCQEWIVPYIGDLLGVRNLNPIGDGAGISQRAYVANTIGYRRRKGIAPVLEQLTLDATGWRAHVVEFFELLQTSQYMNHIRLHRTVTPDLRKMDELDRINTAFDTVAHSADVRHIASGRGKYNIPNIGIFTWRLQSYPLSGCDASRSECVPGPFVSPPLSPPSPQFVFTFNPTGKKTQLFNKPETETAITHISAEINVPGLLRRRILFDELEALRIAFEKRTTRIYNFFESRSEDQDEYVFEIIRVKNEIEEKILPEEIMICNLEHCCTPPSNIVFKELKQDGSIVNRKIKALADPVCGKFMFTEQDPDVTAIVSYSYGFSGDIGGGPYNRQSSVPENFFKKEDTDQVWQVGVSKEVQPVHGENIYKTIGEAITEWHLQPEGTVGVITIMDSRTYEEDLDIGIDKKTKLLIIAADWPVREDPNDGSPIRNAGDLLAEDLRPFISGNITITGDGDKDAPDTCGEITINGILIKGQVSISEGQLGKFNLIHSTVIPENGGIEIGAGAPDMQSNQWLTLTIDRSISGTIGLHDTAAVKLIVSDSILDKNQKAGSAHAIEALNTPVQLNCVTLFGISDVKTIEASNCIFNETVIAKRRQEGCIRFSFVPIGSKTPRLYRCQPTLEINDQIAEATGQKGSQLSPAAKNKIRNDVEKWLQPSFTSIVYDHYAYGQLSVKCPEQISAGADNGAEMGAFNFLKQPQRKANLQIALNEYLPLGLEAGIIYVT